MHALKGLYWWSGSQPDIQASETTELCWARRLLVKSVKRKTVTGKKRKKFSVNLKRKVGKTRKKKLSVNGF